MTGIKKINLISAVLVSLSLCGGCTLEKAGNSSQDQTVQEDNKTEQVKAEKAEKEEINEIHLRDKDLSLIHISEPTRRTPISYAVFCLKKKKQQKKQKKN